MSSHSRKLASRYRVDHPKKFRIKHTDPGDTWKFKSKDEAKDLLRGRQSSA